MRAQRLFGVDDKTALKVVHELFGEFVSDVNPTIMSVAKTQGFPETHSEELYRAYVFGMMVQRNENRADLGASQKAERK